MNNFENSDRPNEKTELTESQKENISANTRINTENYLAQNGITDLNYLNNLEENKSGSEVLIGLVTDYCIKNKILNSSFITNEGGENLKDILIDLNGKSFPGTFNKIPKSGIISIITQTFPSIIIEK